MSILEPEDFKPKLEDSFAGAFMTMTVIMNGLYIGWLRWQMFYIILFSSLYVYIVCNERVRFIRTLTGSICMLIILGAASFLHFIAAVFVSVFTCIYGDYISYLLIRMPTRRRPTKDKFTQIEKIKAAQAKVPANKVDEDVFPTKPKKKYKKPRTPMSRRQKKAALKKASLSNL